MIDVSCCCMRDTIIVVDSLVLSMLLCTRTIELDLILQNSDCVWTYSFNHNSNSRNDEHRVRKHGHIHSSISQLADDNQLDSRRTFSFVFKTTSLKSSRRLFSIVNKLINPYSQFRLRYTFELLAITQTGMSMSIHHIHSIGYLCLSSYQLKSTDIEHMLEFHFHSSLNNDDTQKTIELVIRFENKRW
jgi:hypothetical protein